MEEIIGSIFLVLALAVVVAVFIGQPFLQRTSQKMASDSQPAVQEREHRESSLLAERDRVLNALQELDFDYALGKVPPEDYPQQRAVLLKTGANVLRELDEIENEELSPAVAPAGNAGIKSPVETSAANAAAEDRIEAAVAARRADAAQHSGAARQENTAGQPGTAPVTNQGTNGNGNGKSKDELEEIIASRKRARKESAAGFCPRCGKPVQKSDKFCSKCGSTL
jgi:hypothetical protein